MNSQHFRVLLQYFKQWLSDEVSTPTAWSLRLLKNFLDGHLLPIYPAQCYVLMKAGRLTIWTAHADNRAFSLTIGPSRCLALCRGNRAAQQHIGGSEKASDAPGHVPKPPSPHNLACSVPTQWQTHLRWQLWWTLNSSGDKCRDHSLLPTQAFNHDALLLLLTFQTLYRVKSCYSYIGNVERVLGVLNWWLFHGGVLPGDILINHLPKNKASVESHSKESYSTCLAFTARGGATVHVLCWAYK